MTASLDNCKRLYELSGWTDTCGYYHSLISHDTQRWSEYKLQDYKPDNEFGMRVVPAYTAGYLLRKLPKSIGTRWLTLEICDHNEQPEWVADYYSLANKYLISVDNADITHADTPEDALCLLAIQLFEQSILIRDKL